jgi:tetratricopeptide (TPR) repeat protein
MLAITISFAAGVPWARTVPCLNHSRPKASLTLVALAWWALSLPWDASAQTRSAEERARQTYAAASERFQTNRQSLTTAWQLGQAAFELADLLPDDRERSQIAQAGLDASRQAVALDADSPQAHYYLALNLGESARAKKLAALRILREMERELLKAAQLQPGLDYGGPDRALGMLYLRAPPWPASVGNRNKARAHLQAAVELSPDYPDNHLCLGEAYAKWNETKNLERTLRTLEELLPKARARFAGEEWMATWDDWQKRFLQLQKDLERQIAHPRASPSERGARKLE